MSLFGAVKIF